MAALQGFEIDYRGLAAGVVEHRLPSGRVFHIQFSQPTLKPLVITVAHDSEDRKFWTSLPEGRQELAEEVGRLVATFIRKQAKLCAITTDKR
ncbi:hypothetical protein [Mucilaginibacter agri]|uniref:Uncharacterized protein n=1 Tax=Mucilaginibacter agri TaxID=2695265 RepID=A0A965ZDF4_9SPHI|nr:hypothetical protein [Mucilaginibacter agri]NCD67994.1 hypothetical protein [Mucilaginibacter agri]